MPAGSERQYHPSRQHASGRRLRLGQYLDRVADETMGVAQSQRFDRVTDVPVAMYRHGRRPSKSVSRSSDTPEMKVLIQTLITDGRAVLRIREDTSVVEKRFGFPENSAGHFAEMIEAMIETEMVRADTGR